MEIKELERDGIKNKRLLVTGATGFLGSRIVRAYEKNCQIYAPGHEEMDICDMASVKAYMEKVRPQAAVHCAAVSDTGWCQDHPEESWRINVEGMCLRLCWMYDRERLLEKEHGNFLTAFLQAS